MARGRKSRTTVFERVLALDTSSVCCGWAVFDAGALVKSGRFVQQGKHHGEKLAGFGAWLQSLFLEWTPTQVVYEKPFSGRRRNAFAVLQLYIGVLLLEHWNFTKMELPEANAVPARAVKSRNEMKSGLNHAANKRAGVMLVNKLFNLRLKYKENDKTKKITQDDEADAILLGRAWLLDQRPESMT